MSLEIKDLTFRYKKKTDDILNGLTLSLKEGDVTVLLGPNGCGKTTFLRSLFGEVKAEGSVFFNGRDLNLLSLKEKNNIIGYLTQEMPIESSLTVFEVILLGNIGRLGIKPDKETLNHVAKIIEEFHLDKIGNTPYSELSGGQQRIVNIAQILSKDPQILILDEPTTNLDIANELEVLNLIHDYVKQKNIICLMVLHSINMAARFSDKIVFLKDGKVYKEGKPAEVITEENMKETYGVIVRRSTDENGCPSIHLIKSLNTKGYKFNEKD